MELGELACRTRRWPTRSRTTQAQGWKKVFERRCL